MRGHSALSVPIIAALRWLVIRSGSDPPPISGITIALLVFLLRFQLLDRLLVPLLVLHDLILQNHFLFSVALFDQLDFDLLQRYVSALLVRMLQAGAGCGPGGLL